MIRVVVHMPAAWCFVPLRDSAMVADPGNQRWRTDGDLDWRQIADAVSDAVQFAQRELADPMSSEVEVELDHPLPHRERMIVEQWVWTDPPQFGPEHADLTNGRHRTWFSHRAGAREAPVLNGAVGAAIRHWNDPDRVYGRVDDELLQAWRAERDRWDAPDAVDWATRNRTHLRLWDRAIDLWSERLGV